MDNTYLYPIMQDRQNKLHSLIIEEMHFWQSVGMCLSYNKLLLSNVLSFCLAPYVLELYQTFCLGLGDNKLEFSCTERESIIVCFFVFLKKLVLNL